MTTASQALVEHDEPKALSPVVDLPEGSAIFAIIERAARDPSVDIDKMERLIVMQERMQANRSKSEFAAAFAAMQPDLPIIPEHGEGHNKASYALWEDVNELIKPVLAKHGFGLSFKPSDAQGGVQIVAILMHSGGHSEETTKFYPADTSGNKNAIQAIGSSISYGKRYTASALLNLSSRKEDDDGTKGGGDPVNPTKSAASLKKDQAWETFIREVDACGSLSSLAIVWKKWTDVAKEDNWPAPWRFEAREYLQKTYDDLKAMDERDAMESPFERGPA